MFSNPKVPVVLPTGRGRATDGVSSEYTPLAEY